MFPKEEHQEQQKQSGMQQEQRTYTPYQAQPRQQYPQSDSEYLRCSSRSPLPAPSLCPSIFFELSPSLVLSSAQPSQHGDGLGECGV
jgi:hypothetical protein